MTNHQFLDNQVLQEPTAANKDAGVLAGSRAVQFGQFEDEVSQAKDRLSAWMENDAVQMSEVSITHIVGFMLGRFLYPARQPHKLTQVV